MLFHSVCLTVVSHAWHIDAVDVRWCLSCLHGLALRSLGSWLGGSWVSALRLFCFGTNCPIRCCFWLFLLLFPTDGLLGTWYTSCLVTSLFTAAWYDASFPLAFLLVPGFCCCLFACFLWLVWFLCLLFVFVGWSFLKPVERHHTALALRAQEANYSFGFTCAIRACKYLKTLVDRYGSVIYEVHMAAWVHTQNSKGAVSSNTQYQPTGQSLPKISPELTSELLHCLTAVPDPWPMAKITIDIEKPAQWVSKLSCLYFADIYARKTEGFPNY